MLEPWINKNDRKARIFIYGISIIVLATVIILSRTKLDVNLSFDVHIFAVINAVINSLVSCLLIAGLFAVRISRYKVHRRIMLTAIVLSVLFLISYIAHHLLAGETRFGDIDHNGIVSDDEKAQVGSLRSVYYFLLLTHIPLAAIIMPFVLFTAYRGLTGEYASHRKLSRVTWPIWLYVALSGVLVYLLIQPYYH